MLNFYLQEKIFGKITDLCDQYILTYMPKAIWVINMGWGKYNFATNLSPMEIVPAVKLNITILEFDECTIFRCSLYLARDFHNLRSAD